MTSRLSQNNALLVLPLMILPVLTYLGSRLNIATHDNALLLLAILMIGILVFVITLPGDVIPEKLYPVVIVTISFCLLFQVVWMSPHLIGSDVHLEYFLFELTKSSGHWNSQYPNYYASALSVTILPAIVQSVIAADDTALFKAMYPLAFSLVPLIMYLAYRYVTDSKRAFVSAIFLMSYTAYFLGVSFIGKQEIAEVILSLLILLILSTGKKVTRSRRLLMLMLIAGLVISHYSLAYIYLAFLFLSWPLLAVLKRRSAISLPFVTFFALIAFGWYIYTAGGTAFTGLVEFGDSLFVSMISDFFKSTSRDPLVLNFLGIGIRPALVNSINLLVQYSVQAFIVVGVVRLWKRRKSVNAEFLSYASLSLLLLILSVALPYFAFSINLNRIYQIALIFLSPACVLGGEGIFTGLSRALSTLRHRPWHVSLPDTNRSLTFASCIIVLFLLFNTGFMNEITAAPPISISLGMNRMSESHDAQYAAFLYGTYIPEQDYTSAQWLSKYMVRNESVCADFDSRWKVLLSYAGIPLEEGGPGVPLLRPGSKTGCIYVYLNYKNVVKNVIEGLGIRTQVIYRTSEIGDLYSGRNRIYSNGGGLILVLVCQSSEC